MALPLSHPLLDPFAQTVTRASPPMNREVFLWLGIIVLLAMVLVVVALLIRKKLIGTEDPAPVGFTLKALRELHAQGQLSDEELARAEAKSLADSRALYLGAEAEEAGIESEQVTDDQAAEDARPENHLGSSDKNGDDKTPG